MSGDYAFLKSQTWRRLPRRVIALDGQFKPKHYRIQKNLLGQISVFPQSDLVPLKPDEDCLLCLDPSILYRRKANFNASTRSDLRRLAADLFPFADDDTQYAASSATLSAAYIYALPFAEMAQLQKIANVPVAAVLPCADDKASVESAIQQRLYGVGDLIDLHGSPARFLSPAIASFAAIALIFLLIVFGGAFMWQWQNQWHKSVLSQDIAALESEALPAQKRANAIAIMQSTLLAAQQIQTSASAKAFVIVSQLVASIPNGISIDRIEFKDNKLAISGLGKNPQSWLIQNGFAERDIQITPMPQIDRYAATQTVADVGKE